MPGLPRNDIGRIARAVNAFESGELTRPAPGQNATREGADFRGILLRQLNADGVTGDSAPQPAVELQPVSGLAAIKRAFLLRVVNDTRPFRLSWNGDESDDIPTSTTAEQLRGVVNGLSGLSDAVVIGRGMSFGVDAVSWQSGVFFLGVTADSGFFQVNPSPGNWADATIARTLDWPLDRVEQIYPRYAGDAAVGSGSIVTCRPTPVGYRVISAGLIVPDPCPPQNCKIHVSLMGRPTAGTWGITLRHNAENEDGETYVVAVAFDDLAWDISAEDLQAVIDADASFGGKVLVIGGPAHRGDFELEFVEELGNQPIPMPLLRWGLLEGVVANAHARYGQIGRAAEVVA